MAVNNGQVPMVASFDTTAREFNRIHPAARLFATSVSSLNFVVLHDEQAPVAHSVLVGGQCPGTAAPVADGTPARPP